MVGSHSAKEKEHRIAVTGMGIVTPIGESPDEFFDSLIAGRSGIGYWKHLGDKIYSKIGGDLSDFDFVAHFAKYGRGYPTSVVKQAKKRLRVTPLSGRLAVVASLQAVSDAGLLESHIRPERLAHVLAGHNLNQDYFLRNVREFDNEPEFIDPLFGMLVFDTDSLAIVSELVNARGPCFMVGNACASGNLAVLTGIDLLRLGRADMVVVSGVSGDLDPVLLQGLTLLGSLSTESFNHEPIRASRPFDGRREGFVPSHGAAAVILERRDHAEMRGAQIHGEVLGVSSTSDASRLTKPNLDGEVRAMHEAMKDASLTVEEVNYVNAHGTSTPLGDAVEVAAIKTVFGEYAYKIPVNSTKSMLGHCLYAAGIVELISTILQIQRHMVHPTINQEVSDPELDLDFVPNQAREHRIQVALSNSFGFGGLNSCIAIGPAI